MGAFKESPKARPKLIPKICLQMQLINNLRQEIRICGRRDFAIQPEIRKRIINNFTEKGLLRWLVRSHSWINLMNQTPRLQAGSQWIRARVMTSSHSFEWDSLKNNKTWKLIYSPHNRSVLKGRWVFKARWVVKDLSAPLSSWYMRSATVLYTWPWDPLS